MKNEFRDAALAAVWDRLRASARAIQATKTPANMQRAARKQKFKMARPYGLVYSAFKHTKLDKGDLYMQVEKTWAANGTPRHSSIAGGSDANAWYVYDGNSRKYKSGTIPKQLRAALRNYPNNVHTDPPNWY